MLVLRPSLQYDTIACFMMPHLHDDAHYNGLRYYPCISLCWLLASGHTNSQEFEYFHIRIFASLTQHNPRALHHYWLSTWARTLTVTCGDHMYSHYFTYLEIESWCTLRDVLLLSLSMAAYWFHPCSPQWFLLNRILLPIAMILATLKVLKPSWSISWNHLYLVYQWAGRYHSLIQTGGVQQSTHPGKGYRAYNIEGPWLCYFLLENRKANSLGGGAHQSNYPDRYSLDLRFLFL